MNSAQEVDAFRRRFLALTVCVGAGSTVFGRALATTTAGQPRVTEQMIRQAEWVAGLSFEDTERRLMLQGVNQLLEDFAKLREVPLDNGVAPALIFRPPAGRSSVAGSEVRPLSTAAGARPATAEDLAFAPVTAIGPLLRERLVSSVELTRLYLDRLKRLDPSLQCVISVTEELALRQADRADRELAAGHYRGPLHGVPWGAKDLLAARGYPTTWGATPYREQTRPEQATVVSRLEQAGAVLLAKLTLGELAWGDVWFGGATKNPWRPEQGSSGSSAGSAAATAAGLVGFAIGSETWGSIVSPCTRCGVTGLRPTFGRISRHGAMTLSFSMDKLGPIARSVEDCALVFAAIQGADGLDPSVVDHPFGWPCRRDLRSLKVGYVADLFEEDRAAEVEDEKEREAAREWQRFDLGTLEVLRSIGLQLEPIELAQQVPVASLAFILTAEAAATFDDLTRGGRDASLVRQVEQAWPNVFRQGQLIPAVEYLRANRIRTLAIQELERRMEALDVFVAPSFGGDCLLLTNLTGHPAVVVPNGFRSTDGTPTSITFTGRLNGETELLAVARAYQQATDFHLRRPPLSAGME